MASSMVRATVFRSCLVAAVALGAALARPSQDESLAELARQAKEKKQKAGAKVYTDDDLRGGRRPSPEPSPSATPAAREGDQGANTADLDREAQQRQALEQKWRARFDAARNKIADAERRCWRTVIRAETGPGGLIVPMQVREFEETEEFRNARQALADLEEELRRAGLPPGWSR